MAVELGGFAGISLHNLTNPYDTLAFRLDLKHDVAGAHSSTVISPNIEFATPLSRTTYVSATTSMDFVSDKYARYYFGVTPADALASGLPVFNPDGGMKAVSTMRPASAISLATSPTRRMFSIRSASVKPRSRLSP